MCTLNITRVEKLRIFYGICLNFGGVYHTNVFTCGTRTPIVYIYDVTTTEIKGQSEKLFSPGIRT